MDISPISGLSNNLPTAIFFTKKINLDTKKININLNNKETIFYYLHNINNNIKKFEK